MIAILKQFAIAGFLVSLSACINRDCEDLPIINLSEQDKALLPYQLNQKIRFVHRQYNDTFWMNCTDDQFTFVDYYLPNSEGCGNGYQFERRTVGLKSKYLNISFRVALGIDNNTTWDYRHKPFFSFSFDFENETLTDVRMVDHNQQEKFQFASYADSLMVNGIQFNEVFIFSCFVRSTNQFIQVYYTLKEGFVGIEGISSISVVKVD